MADIDVTMLDCAEILHGYQKALIQIRESTLMMEEEYDESRNQET